MNDEKKEWQNKLIYIDNYPAHWKYIALFAKSGDATLDEQAEQQRIENMAKILKTVEFKNKIREEEILRADRDSD